MFSIFGSLRALESLFFFFPLGLDGVCSMWRLCGSYYVMSNLQNVVVWKRGGGRERETELEGETSRPHVVKRSHFLLLLLLQSLFCLLLLL